MLTGNVTSTGSGATVTQVAKLICYVLVVV